jgi:hypothetical protein
LITTLAEAGEVHPAALVTVYVCDPTAIPESVVLVVDPAIAPGLMVQVPTGKPLNRTLPVAKAQVGWVIVPTNGATGVIGCTLITTLADATDMHPTEFVTVKLYVPATIPVIVVLVVDPAMAPGLIVQAPAGKPLNITLPVAKIQVGCVMVPTMGAVGEAEAALNTTFAVATEVHPAALVTV